MQFWTVFHRYFAFFPALDLGMCTRGTCNYRLSDFMDSLEQRK